jgi:hypothetical protein
MCERLNQCGLICELGDAVVLREVPIVCECRIVHASVSVGPEAFAYGPCR